MLPRGTAVQFELGDQIDVEESAAATPRSVTAWERHMRGDPIDYDAIQIIDRVRATVAGRSLTGVSSRGESQA